MENHTVDGGGAVQADSDPKASEFLTLTLGREEYGIDIQKVQELRGYGAITHLANAPDHIKGVINLRGAIVPIVDMRIKFRLATPVYNEFTVVVVLNLAGRVVGMVVDSVTDVVTLERGQIKPPPDLGMALDANFITGLGALDERMLILVDIDRMLAFDDVVELAQLAA